MERPIGPYSGRDQKVCSEQECERPKKGLGLCELHLSRSRQTPITCKHCSAVFDNLGGRRRSYCYTCVPQNHYKQASSLMKEYDLSWDEWQAMYFEQDGKCAILSCDREARVVDHCHVNGNIRGLLCHGCNSGLGHLENPSWVRSATSYVEENRP